MDAPYGHGKSWFLVNEEQLREKIIELSPDIHRDTERMSDLMREIVKLEREKTGLDKRSGKLELTPNKEKKDKSEPDFTGQGIVAGRSYSAAAWGSISGKLRVSLLPFKV
jgi:hypothetical protein